MNTNSKNKLSIQVLGIVATTFLAATTALAQTAPPSLEYLANENPIDAREVTAAPVVGTAGDGLNVGGRVGYSGRYGRAAGTGTYNLGERAGEGYVVFNVSLPLCEGPHQAGMCISAGGSGQMSVRHNGEIVSQANAGLGLVTFNDTFSFGPHAGLYIQANNGRRARATSTSDGSSTGTPIEDNGTQDNTDATADPEAGQESGCVGACEDAVAGADDSSREDRGFRMGGSLSVPFHMRSGRIRIDAVVGMAMMPSGDSTSPIDMALFADAELAVDLTRNTAVTPYFFLNGAVIAGPDQRTALNAEAGLGIAFDAWALRNTARDVSAVQQDNSQDEESYEEEDDGYYSDADSAY